MKCTAYPVRWSHRYKVWREFKDRAVTQDWGTRDHEPGSEAEKECIRTMIGDTVMDCRDKFFGKEDNEGARAYLAEFQFIVKVEP